MAQSRVVSAASETSGTSPAGGPADSDNPFHPLATATLNTTVFDVVHLFSELGISGVPIVDQNGACINLYETLDVVELVRQDAYSQLDLTIAQALSRRNKDFQGVVKCTPEDTLANVMSYIRERRVHRMVIVDSKERLVGVLTLSDILRYLSGAVDLDPVQLVGCGCPLFFVFLLCCFELPLNRNLVFLTVGMVREGESATDLTEPMRFLGLRPISKDAVEEGDVSQA